MQYNSKKYLQFKFVDFLTNKNVLSFNFDDWNDKADNNFVNMIDRELNEMILNSNFKYYDNHEFHKLKQKCSNNRNSSNFHSNLFIASKFR